jgi:hypothetical protein
MIITLEHEHESIEKQTIEKTKPALFKGGLLAISQENVRLSQAINK